MPLPLLLFSWHFGTTPGGGGSGVKFICSARHREPVKGKRHGITLTAWVKTCVPLFYLLFHLCRTKSNSPLAVIKLMRRPSGDAYVAVLCLVVHRCGKVLFVCRQSFAPERISHWSRWPCAKTFSGLCSRGKNNESNCCNFARIFPRGLSSELFISLRLLVITDLRPLQVSGQPSFMDICLLSCPDL